MTRRLSAAIVVASPERVLAPGELVFDRRGRVLHVGPLRSRRRAPPRAIVPGLVDAHVHLQIPELRRAVRSFLPWVDEVMQSVRTGSADDHRQRALRAVTALLESGATAVGEVDSTGCSPAVLRESALAGRCYQELTGFDLGARGAAELLERRRRAGSRRCPAGFSPHAPYSVSPALFRAARRSGSPMMVHVAEIAEEQELLRAGRGPLRALLERLGRWPRAFRPPEVSSVSWLARLGVLGPRCALVHAQHLAAGDAERIAAAAASIVVCPGTIDYFRRAAPPVPQWLALGITVALGTDSAASNRGLDMRAEMVRAHCLWPALSSRQVLAMATVAGGRALCRPSLGRLRPGGGADFVVVDLPDRAEPRSFLDRFTRGELTRTRTWLQGAPVAARG